jgi:hypothetical protein
LIEAWCDLVDFCEAHRGAPGNRIVQDALRAFIDERLQAEPELKKGSRKRGGNALAFSKATM